LYYEAFEVPRKVAEAAHKAEEAAQKAEEAARAAAEAVRAAAERHRKSPEGQVEKVKVIFQSKNEGLNSAEAKYYVPREKFEEEVASRLAALDGIALIIFGEKGCGKTSVVSKCVGGREGIIVVRFQDDVDEASFVATFCEAAGIDMDALPEGNWQGLCCWYSRINLIAFVHSQVQARDGLCTSCCQGPHRRLHGQKSSIHKARLQRRLRRS
jgi:hypothetical protein